MILPFIATKIKKNFEFNYELRIILYLCSKFFQNDRKLWVAFSALSLPKTA